MGTFGQIIVAIQNYGDEDKYQVVLTAEVGIDGQEMPGNVASLVKWFSEEGDAMSLGDALKGACDCLPSREVRAEVILGGETIELGEGAIGDSTQVYLRRCELEDGPVWQAYQARDEGCDPKDVTATDLPLNTPAKQVEDYAGRTRYEYWERPARVLATCEAMEEGCLSL